MPSGNTKGKYKMKRMFPKRSRINIKRVVANKDIGTAKRLSKVNAPLSMTLKTTMLYTTDAAVNLSSTGVNPGTVVYSLNGMYDPEITGTFPVGHQPRGFDQLVGVLYDHYVVIGAKVRIDVANLLSNTPGYVIATIRDGAVTSNNYTAYTESNNSQWKILGGESSDKSTVSLNLKINPNQFLGRSKPMADPELKGSSTANPLEQCYLHVSGMSLNQFTPSRMTAMVSIEYTAILIEPKQPPQS